MVNDDRYRVRIADGELVMDERAPLDLEWSVPAADVLREGPAAAWIRARLGEDELARIRELVRHPPPPRALPTVPSLDGLREPMWRFTVELATRLGLPAKTAPPRLRAWTCPAPVTDRSEPWSEHVDAWFDVGDAHVAFSASSSYWREAPELRSCAQIRSETVRESAARSARPALTPPTSATPAAATRSTTTPTASSTSPTSA